MLRTRHLPLWPCGQRDSVERHIHSHVDESTTDPFARLPSACGYERLVWTRALYNDVENAHRTAAREGSLSVSSLISSPSLRSWAIAKADDIVFRCTVMGRAEIIG